jgi:hypothetical protein
MNSEIPLSQRNDNWAAGFNPNVFNFEQGVFGTIQWGQNPWAEKAHFCCGKKLPGPR